MNSLIGGREDVTMEEKWEGDRERRLRLKVTRGGEVERKNDRKKETKRQEGRKEGRKEGRGKEKGRKGKIKEKA